MRGVDDITNMEHYANMSSWRACVTSRFVLHELATMLKPNFFEKLIGVARKLSDHRLEGIALKGYFHTLVRHQRLIRIYYCKYDNLDWRQKTKEEWLTIMNEEAGSIICTQPMKVNCEGYNVEKCIEVTKQWAADLSTMDYWIPANSLCGTIDAVAKWTFPDETERICFIQLTNTSGQKCDAEILWQLAQPFVTKGWPVCYIVILLSDIEKIPEFRLDPVNITKQEVLDHIPMFVANCDILQKQKFSD